MNGSSWNLDAARRSDDPRYTSHIHLVVTDQVPQQEIILNINQLRYFVAIVDHGSFREASDSLGLSQPALSNSIKALEKSVQVQLLERGKSGALPTPYGKVLYDFFKSAAASVERGFTEVELMRQGSKGQLTIGAPTGLMDLFLPDILEGVIVRQPGTTFVIQYGYLDGLLEALRHGELDFLLTPYWPDILLHDDIEIEKLAELDLSIFASPGHPLTNREIVAAQDLLAADWIFADSAGMTAFRYQLFGENFHRVNVKIMHNYPPFLINMMQKINLLTLIPDYIVKKMNEPGRLERINYPDFHPSLSTGLIYMKGRHMTPSMELFADLARTTQFT